MTRARIFLIVAFAVALAALAIHWSPARQVRLHQDGLQRAVENRNWKRVGEYLSPDYHDRWEQDRALALEQLPQAFQDFLAIGIVEEDSSIDRVGDSRVVRSRLKIVGSGGPLAQLVMGEVEKLREPFVFTWQRASWKPWDWKLVSIDQPEIDAPNVTF